MEEAVTDFPFRIIRNDIYLTIDVMMYVERSLALQTMFSMNKASRTFLLHNYNSIQNGFINEGLITYDLEFNFRDFE
jgi:hypothetical protein